MEKNLWCALRIGNVKMKIYYLGSLLTNDGKYDKEIAFKILRKTEEFR